MVYLTCQHAIKMVVMWYDGVVSSFDDLSDLTWHMFTHVVETNQHSLHDIYVHGVHILLMLVSNITYA